MTRDTEATWAGGDRRTVTGGAGASCSAIGTGWGSCSWLMTRMVNTPTVAAESARPTSGNPSERAQ
jgi:hypothetical protein